MSGFQIDWKPPGPIAAAFLHDLTFVTAIMGPVGSGKTTAALMKIITTAAMQRPSPVDGIRRCKALVIRDTFVNIKRTVLPTWHGWFPESAGQWVGGPPAQHKLNFDMGHGPIELIVDFIGLGDDTIENVLRSYEMTCFYANEADLLSFDVISFLTTRLNRYPSMLHGGPVWSGGWMDFNAPEQDHWLHELLVEKRIPGGEGQAAEGFKFFRQPGGTEPGAENMRNLVEGYYQRQMMTNPPWRVRRMVHNQWGYSRDGKPVYPEFNDDLHVASQRLEPIRGIPIGIGLDAGGTPAAAFGQWLPGNRWRIMAEISTPPGTGPTRFAEMVTHVLAERFPGFDRYGWADPSAANGEDEAGGDLSWLTTVKRKTGINFRPTSSNAPSLRQEAIRSPLTRLVEGMPAFQICPSCTQLRKGFNSGYHYRRIKVGGATGRFDTKPDKNIFSHLNEACEYLVLGGGEGRQALTGGKVAARGNFATADNDYDMYGDGA